MTVLGLLSPGNSPGVITLGSLVLGGTSTTVVEINDTTRGLTYDGITITGSDALTYGGLLTFAFGNVAAFADNTTFNIFDFAGLSTGTLASITSTGFYSGTWNSTGGGTFTLDSNGQTLTFSQATGDISVIPEPASLTLAAIGLAAGVAVYRHRRSRIA